MNNGYSELTVTREEGVQYDLFIPELSLSRFDTNGDGSLSSQELEGQTGQIMRYLQDGIRLQQNMEDMGFHLQSMNKNVKESVPGVSFQLYYTSSQPITGFTIQYNLLFDDSDPNHLNFAIMVDGNDSDQTVFDASHRSYHFESSHAASLGTTLWRYFTLGIEHFATGYDHLLFLLSLLVIADSYKRIVQIVTAFTIAHSVTLLLTALGYVNVNPVWVEAAIALTIGYVAIENIVSPKHSLRSLLTFLFGLVHGMGFAGALGEIGLPANYFVSSLVAFNAGVEAAQLILVITIMPMILWLRNKAGYKSIVVGGSAVIGVQALWWLLERTGVIG
ncbi:HupE/UreJ family protein [Paenibacillus sp. H1-7]|uniref:HupE/UreJ family protein n=1 Tax=Paenibacillus sp. H1-7 TaxID=2282849 RepID=UPI001EF919EA|nr:HupE/UreJ family protein [Paenibacillus sp. H1-7]